MDFARDTADVTDRENIQFHWIRIEDVPEDLGVAGPGLVCPASRRVATHPGRSSGHPSPGSPPTRSSTARARSRRSAARALGNPAYSNLPRKFKTAVTGHPSHDVSPETNDVAFVGTVHPELGPGFDLWVGGGLSTNPMLAQRARSLDRVGRGRGRLGGRDVDLPRLRLPAAASRARLKFLVADWGIEKFREVLENEYLGGDPWSPCPSSASPSATATTSGSTPRRTASCTSGSRRPSDESPGTLLVRLADLLERYAVAGARLTPYQKIVLIGVAPEHVDGLLGRPG